MKQFKHYLILAVCLMLSVAAVAQTAVLGYTNGNVQRKLGYRFSSTTTQGMAIRLSAEKLALLKGASITGIKTAFGTSQISDFKVFITKELGGEPLYTQTLTGAGTTLKEFKFDTPYTLDVNTPLYIGYTITVAETYKPLLFDLSSNTDKNLSWVWDGEKWVDVSQSGIGAANIQLVLNGVASFADLMLKPVNANGYYKAGTPYAFSGQIFNFGTETVQSFDITYQLGTNEPVVYNVTNANLSTGKYYDFVLPEYSSVEVGTMPLNIKVSNVNGVSDKDAADNESMVELYLYPADMEKKILLEMFTGQACGQCPGGHKVLAAAIAGKEENVIEVAHHAGYAPDYFTMQEDMDYLWFYDPSSVYAPAAMFNRVPYSVGLTTPVLQANISSYVNSALATAENTPPYVSVKLYNEFDAATRTGVATVDVYTYEMPEEGHHRLTLFLTQNGMISGQSGASGDYEHNHVFRGALNGTWGEAIDLVEGKIVRKTISYTIPESIVSSYTGDSNMSVAWEAIPENMHIVAFVGSITVDNRLACPVYNAEVIGVTENISAVGSVDMNQANVSFLHRGEGCVQVSGDYRQIEVYSISGAKMKTLTATENALTLESGIYVVRILSCNGSVLTRKLVVE